MSYLENHRGQQHQIAIQQHVKNDEISLKHFFRLFYVALQSSKYLIGFNDPLPT